jgi:cobalt/nickel transport protein
MTSEFFREDTMQRAFSFLLACFFFTASPALAHFGVILPSDDIVGQGDPRNLSLELKFMHPFEGGQMDMARPQQFGVLHRGARTDLIATLQEQQADGQTARWWYSDFAVKRPGDHTFYVVPAPYWEPAEDLFIVHYTKVCVAALGLEDGWGQPVGLETEIVPLTRPYGLWSGNLFSGQVLLHGRPVPFAEIEVEFINGSDGAESKVVPPEDAYITQVIKADAGGIFHYAMPRAGWWGFSALSEADWTLPHKGRAKAVEIGAVFWVRTRDMR